MRQKTENITNEVVLRHHTQPSSFKMCPGSIPGTTRKKKRRVVGLERDPLGLVSTTEELLDRKVAAPV
jgi:hypothetical protein